MRRALILFSLLIGVAGCGDLAPTDASVEGPEDATTEIPAAGGSPIFYRPLDFLVTNSSGEPVSKIEIEFFAGGVADLTDIGGTVLATPKSFKTETDERGLARIGANVTVPQCAGGATPLDIKVDGSVLATVGSDSHLWTATVTRKCAAATP